MEFEEAFIRNWKITSFKEIFGEKREGTSKSSEDEIASAIQSRCTEEFIV